MTAGWWERVESAAAAIRARDVRVPQVALVLGSGLGAYANSLNAARAIPYAEIPDFPVSTVAGHAGNLVLGEVGGMPVAAMQGRTHLYEGHAADAVVFPLRVLWLLGCRVLVVTNSAGGLRPHLGPGTLVALTDHINLTGQNPLVGPNDARFGPRFPDLTEAYDPRLRELAVEVARSQGIPLELGIYAGLLGPNYETPAEVRYVGILGADLVGMSTVVEVIAARHLGMRVLGISCVSNAAAGLGAGPLSHEEVTQTARRATGALQGLINGVLRRLAQEVMEA